MRAFVLVIVLILCGTVLTKTVRTRFVCDVFQLPAPPQYCAFVDEVIHTNLYYQTKYKSLLPSLRHSGCTPTIFKRLPILSKQDIQRHYRTLIHPYTPCKIPHSSYQLIDQSVHHRFCAYPMSTGGTSGKTSYMWFGPKEAHLYISTFIESFKRNGYQCGDNMLIFYPKDSYVSNEYESMNALLNMTNVHFQTFQSVNLSTVRKLLDNIQRKHVDFLVVFPFVFLQICLFIHRHNIRLRHQPRNINLSGEYLLANTLRFCQSIFTESTIENTYGAVEFGEIAHQIPQNKNVLKVLSSTCYAENDTDGRLIITSYLNRVMPLIRYKMEDLCTVTTRANGVQYITNLVGKDTNRIVRRGHILTTIDLDRFLEHIEPKGGEPAVVAAVIEYDTDDVSMSYIVSKLPTLSDRNAIKRRTVRWLRRRLAYLPKGITVRFTKNYPHDFRKKFKLIVHKDSRDDEPVGGLHKYQHGDDP